MPKWMSCAELLDHNTLIGADKFDSVFACRVPKEARADEGGDMTGLKLKGDTAYLTGQCHKLEHIVNFHVGETVTAMQKASLTPGGADCVVYATVMGSICAMMPLQTKEDVDFLQHLEMILRTERPPLCGRDHLAFRSFYQPCKMVIDGDLCELYSSLTPEKQKFVAGELDRTPAEVLEKLEDVRNRIL